MNIKQIEKKIKKLMVKRDGGYVRIDRYQEVYFDSYKDISYTIDVYAGWKDSNDHFNQVGISIQCDNLKQLIAVAAFKLDDLLDDYDSITIIK